MSGKSKLVTDDVYNQAKAMLAGLGYGTKGIIKLRAIIAAKEHGVSLTAKVFNVSRVSIATWIGKFKDNPSSILDIASGRGRKSRLTEDQLLVVKSWIESNHNLTLQQLSLKVQSEFNVSLSVAAMHKIMKKKLSLSYITPRPKHYKQDSGKHEEFKKKASTRNRKS